MHHIMHRDGCSSRLSNGALERERPPPTGNIDSGELLNTLTLSAVQDCMLSNIHTKTRRMSCGTEVTC